MTPCSPDNDAVNVFVMAAWLHLRLTQDKPTTITNSIQHDMQETPQQTNPTFLFFRVHTHPASALRSTPSSNRTENVHFGLWKRRSGWADTTMSSAPYALGSPPVHPSTAPNSGHPSNQGIMTTFFTRDDTVLVCRAELVFLPKPAFSTCS